MADQVQVKLVADDKAFLKTLQRLRDRFKQLQSASNKAQKTVRQGAQKSKTQLNAQRNSVRLLTNAFARLARVGVASQKTMQTQIRRTSSLLRQQLALLKRARVIPQGTGGRGPLAPTARQARPTRTPASDRPQFFGVPAAQTRPAPTGTPIRNVNAQGNLTQAALAKESAAIQRVAAQREAAAQRAVAGEKRKAASTQTSTASIRKQSQPLTLLVAKFALMAFAVQTLANIVNSTFGAMLRAIDEFQVAAIGTASAITGIAEVGEEGIGEAFTQNLNAALATFEALEIVAARFFSTGQELQLAFNTLAQRGVVIREEEFNVLGKITDQIKLLTGGQNTQIQIQQELRAILDGNVRTTTAFGKSLQARGVDIAQLSREVRATGSLKPFEPFLTGLDAAGPAIRRTLSSVTATFSSLFNILQRNIFQDTFDGIVSTITDINNLIIDQRDTIIQVGVFIKNEIADAWNSVLEVVDLISASVIRLIQNDLVQLGTAIVLIGKIAQRGPLGALLGLAGAFTVASGDASNFGNIVKIIFDLLAIGVQKLIDGLETVVEVFFELLELAEAFTTGGIGLVLDVKSLQRAENRVNDLNKALTVTERQLEFLNAVPERSEGQEERLQAGLRKRLALIREIDGAIDEVSRVEEAIGASDSGGDFLAGRTSRLGDGLQEQLGDFIQTLADSTDEAASSLLKSTKEEASDLLAELRKLASGTGIPPRAEGEFTPTTTPFTTDVGQIQRSFNKLKQEQEKADKDRSTRAKLIFESQRARISLLNQQEKITGADLFKQRAVLVQKEFLFRERELLKEIDQVRERATIERTIVQIRGSIQSTDPGFLNLEKVREQTAKIEVTEAKKLADLNRDIGVARTKASDADRKNTEAILQAQRDLSRELASRRETLGAAFGGETNVERAARTQRASEVATSDLIREQPDLSNQQLVEFAQQQRTMQVQENIRTQLEAVTGAIDAAFQTLIDGIVEGSFEFRDLAKTLSKDFIQAGLQDLIAQTKEAITDGLTSLFEGFSDVAAQRAAQALALGIGLLLAVLSRSGNEGDFTATGGAGGGVNQSSVQTRGLLGGDQNIAIAEINNGLQEALIPTNSILSAIEVNTRGLQGLSLGIDPNELAQAITAQVQSLFSQALLETT